MFFNSAAAAPQAIAYPQSFSPSSSNLGGMSTMMLGLQQQLMTMMSSLLSAMMSGGPSGAASGGVLPSSPSFGMSNGLGGFGGAGGFGAGNSGLGNFLGAAGNARGAVSNARGAASSSASSPRSAAQVPGDEKFTTLNVNIKSRPAMSQKAVLHDVNKAAKNSDLIGWNEISPDRYFDAIKSLGKDWGHYMPKDGKYRISNPISYRKDEFKLIKGGFQKTHEGKADICPDRYITWAKLKHKGSGEKIVRINTHLVSGAFNKSASSSAWRKASWSKHMSKLSAMVSKFEKQGFKVIIGGDFNKDSSKVLGNQVAYDNKLNVATHDGGSTLDYLMHTRGNGLKNLSGGVLGGFNSDHNAVLSTYSLGGRR